MEHFWLESSRGGGQGSDTGTIKDICLLGEKLRKRGRMAYRTHCNSRPRLLPPQDEVLLSPILKSLALYPALELSYVEISGKKD